MDIISYILAKKAAGSGAEALERVAVVEDRVDDLEATVEGLKNGIKYKGAVDYYKDLPSNYTTKQVGYCFTVKYKGESGTQPSGKEYVWGQDGDNLAWIELGGLLDEYVKSITYDPATNSLVIVDQDDNEISFSAATHGEVEAVTDRVQAIEGDYLTSTDKTALEGQIDALDDRLEVVEGKTDLGDFTNDAGYVKQAAIDTALENYTTTADLTTLLAGKEDADATIVKDANYAHISVSSENGVSDGTNTYKYTLPNDVARLSDIPTELPNPNALTIDEAGTTKTYDGSEAVSISIPAIDDFAERDEAVGSFELTIDSSTYVLSLQAKDVNGDNLGSAETIDLPLESMVVSGSYDAENKQLVLELKSGDTIEIPIDDIIAGLQEEITVDNKLDADLVDDTNADNKFVSAQEKQDIADNTAARHTHSNKALLDTYTQTEVDLADAVDKKHSHSNKAVLDDITAAQIEQIGTNTQSITDILNGDSISSFGDVETALNGKEDTINDLADIRAGAALGATAIQPADLATVATTGAYTDLSGTPDLTVYAEKEDLATVATSGEYSDLNNKPDLSIYAESANLATVATSGSYNDLENKPDLSIYAVDSEVQQALQGKQDTISDLNAIRTGAGLGDTAVQPGDNVSDLVNDAGYLTQHQDISNKTDKELTGTNGTSLIFNESTGGGAMFRNTTNNTKSFVGVNDSVPDNNGLGVQIYMLDEVNKTEGVKNGVKINFELDKVTYIKNKATSARTAADELAVKGDITSAVSTKQDTLVSGTNIKTVAGQNILGSGDIAIDVIAPTITIGSDEYSAENGDIELPAKVVDSIEIDTAVTEDSDNLITSGAVYDAIETAVDGIVKKQALTTNYIYSFSQQDWSDLKVNHYFVVSSPVVTGLDSNADLINVKTEINSAANYFTFLKNGTDKYTASFYVEEGNAIYEVGAFYKTADNKLIFRCAQVL